MVKKKRNEIGKLFKVSGGYQNNKSRETGGEKIILVESKKKKVKSLECGKFSISIRSLKTYDNKRFKDIRTATKLMVKKRFKCCMDNRTISRVYELIN